MIVHFIFLAQILASSALLKDDVRKWFEFVSHPRSQCTPNANEEKNTLALSNYNYGLLDFEMGDCSFQNGYSLNYKVEIDNKLKKGSISGTGSISLNSISNHGFKTGICLRSFSPNVLRIDGTFDKNLIQGHFTVYFKDEITMSGFAKDSQIISPVRYFLRNQLVNITENHNNWIERFGYQRFRNNNAFDLYLKLNEDTGVICEQSVSSNFIIDDCQELDLSFEANSCHFHIKPLHSGSRKKFRWNLQNNERHYEGADEFSNCSDEWVKRPKSSQVLRNWLQSVSSLKYDPYWKLQPYPDAMNEGDSKVSLNVPEWNRSNLKMAMDLRTYDRIITTGRNENGQLEFEVDASDTPDIRRDYVFIASDQVHDSSAFKIEFHQEGEDEMSNVDEITNSKLLVVGHLKGGRYHGIVRRFGQLISDPNNSCRKKIFKGLSFVGCYENGVPKGPSWRILPGGGLLYGDVSGDEFTGDNLAFIYPDYETAIVGRFSKGILIEGQEASLIEVRCKNGVFEAKFSKPEGPILFYSPPSNNSAGELPTLKDPFEKKYIYLKESSLDTEGVGEGVFAARDIGDGSTLALYCGYILKPDDLKRYNDKCIQKNEEKGLSKNSDEYYAYMKYHLTVNQCDYVVTFPPEDVKNYKASLGHMLQHSFHPNVMFGDILDTPRSGPCITIVAMRDLQKDEELFVNYRYPEDSPIPWFQKLYQETYRKSSL